MLQRPIFWRLALAAIALLAQSPATVLAQAKLGLVSFAGPAMESRVVYFKEGMRALGHAEGQTYVLESHFTAGDTEKTKKVVQALVDQPVDVLMAWVTGAVHIAKAATQTIPIVMTTTDALATGLVPSLSHPGGNLTGVMMAGPDLAGKRIEILREIRPSVKTVAFVGSTGDANGATFARETSAAGERLGIKVVAKFIGGPGELSESLFEDLKRGGAEAVIIQPLFLSEKDRIAQYASRAQLPVISDYPAFAEAGALFSFGVDETERIGRTAYFVDRILKGAKPADLPVEQPTSFKLVINLRTAKTLGWTISDTFLLRADRVIE